MSYPSKNTIEKEERIKKAKMRKFLKIYTVILMIYTVIVIIFRKDFFLYISAALFVINILIIVKFPQCFSIRAVRKKEKREEYGAAGFLLIPMISSMALMIIRTSNVSYHFIIPSLVIAIIIATVLIVCFRQEWAKEKSSVFGVYLLSFLIAIGLVATIAIPTAKQNLVSSQTAKVTETERRHSGGKNRSTYYECTVKFPDGAEKEYHITKSLYDELRNGDNVKVDTYEGIFGITFTYVSN